MSKPYIVDASEQKLILMLLKDFSSNPLNSYLRGHPLRQAGWLLYCKLNSIKSPLAFRKRLMDAEIKKELFEIESASSCIRNVADIVELAGDDRKTMERKLGLKIHTYEAKKGVVAACKWMVGK